jgi:hypothetical protein
LSTNPENKSNRAQAVLAPTDLLLELIGALWLMSLKQDAMHRRFAVRTTAALQAQGLCGRAVDYDNAA